MSEQVECPVCYRETAYAFRGACESCKEGPERSGPVTVMALAIYRGVRESEGGGYSLGAFEDVGLPMFGGCQRCGASIAAYNACPSDTGYLMCASGCIDGHGYETVEQP